MALFLANEDVEQLISMRDCIDSVEQAYRELGMGRAWNNPRIHTYGQAPDGATHFLKVFTGTVPALGYSILRIDSTMERNESGHATSRKIGSRSIGWLLLFSVETAALARYRAGVGPRQLLDFASLRIRKRLVLALRRRVLTSKCRL